MKNVNLEKDIVNAKENSIETFGVILGWIGAISLVSSVDENHQIINGSPEIGDDKVKELVSELDDFFQTIWVPAINNSYIVLNAIIHISLKPSPEEAHNLYLDSLLYKSKPTPTKRLESILQSLPNSDRIKDNINMFISQLEGVPFARKTLESRCYSEYQLSVNIMYAEIREKKIEVNEDDSELYLIATKEVDGDKVIESLWTKYIVLNKGDESLAKYDYIAKRVELLTLEKDKENAKPSAAELEDIIKGFDQILRKFTSPILQALVTSIASMTLFSKEDGGSDLENNFLERINEIYSPTEDDLEFALSIMGIEGSVSKSANGNFKYYFLDGNNNENSITSESSRKIYRERGNELSNSVTLVEYEKILKEEPHWTNSYSPEQLESILDNKGIESIEVSKKNDEGYGWFPTLVGLGTSLLVGKALGKRLGRTTYTKKGGRDISHRFADRYKGD